MISLASGSVSPVRGLTATDQVVGWGSDSKSVAVSVGNSVSARLDLVDLDSGARTFARDVAPPARAGVVSVRISQWTDGGRTYAYDLERRTDLLFVVK
jgi:hypothetical protein